MVWWSEVIVMCREFRVSTSQFQRAGLGQTSPPHDASHFGMWFGASREGFKSEMSRLDLFSFPTLR
eukprot:SAG11_NODE_363_length_10162_cov_28.285004_5_plen_66_part_00